MAATFGFHPEALFEYAEASKYYLDAASPRVAEAFVTAVESAVSSLVANPLRWRVVESPEIRRYVFTKFPYVLYYRWESSLERVTFYAVMHCSREPGYWRERVKKGS
jgi:toxin ParE1/3/4